MGQVLRIFDDSLERPLQHGLERGRILGLGAGFKQFVSISAYALAFYAGSRFIADGSLKFNMLMRVFLAVTLSAEGIGRITSMAPDTAKAQAAARSLFSLIDAPPPPADPLSDAGDRPAAPMAGRVEFRGVRFAYPNRPDVPVLHDFSLTVEPGQVPAPRSRPSRKYDGNPRVTATRARVTAGRPGLLGLAGVWLELQEAARGRARRPHMLLCARRRHALLCVGVYAAASTERRRVRPGACAEYYV